MQDNLVVETIDRSSFSVKKMNRYDLDELSDNGIGGMNNTFSRPFVSKLATSNCSDRGPDPKLPMLPRRGKNFSNYDR
jgi:hypothetical protein